MAVWFVGLSSPMMTTLSSATCAIVPWKYGHSGVSRRMHFLSDLRQYAGAFAFCEMQSWFVVHRPALTSTGTHVFVVGSHVVLANAAPFARHSDSERHCTLVVFNVNEHAANVPK